MKKAFKFLIFTYIITTNSPSLAYHAHVTVNMIAEKTIKLSDTKNFHASYTTVKDMSPHNVKTYTGTTGEWPVYSQNYPIIYLQATFGISENDSGFKTPYCLVPVEKKYSLSPNEYYKLNINATGWSNKQTGLLICEWSLVKTQ